MEIENLPRNFLMAMTRECKARDVGNTRIERERESKSVCVCICVCERDREREVEYNFY